MTQNKQLKNGNSSITLQQWNMFTLKSINNKAKETETDVSNVHLTIYNKEATGTITVINTPVMWGHAKRPRQQER